MAADRTTNASRRAPSRQAHPGFKNVQAKIAREQGVSSDAAGAILAKSSRGASAKAKRANPRLKKVGGA